MPKPDDEDYMKVWHKYLQSDIDNYQIKRERDTWRKAFYAVAAMLFTFLIVLLVLFGSKLFTLHSSFNRLWHNQAQYPKT